MFKFSSIKVLFIALFCTIFLAACGGDKEDGVVKDYFTAVASGNPDKALSLIYVPEKDKADAAEMAAMTGKIKGYLIEMKQKQFDPQGGLKSIDITNKEFSEDKQKVKVFYTLTFNDGTNKESEITLRLDGSEWKVDLK